MTKHGRMNGATRSELQFDAGGSTHVPYSAYVLIVRRMTSRVPRYARGILGIANGSTRE